MQLRDGSICGNVVFLDRGMSAERPDGVRRSLDTSGVQLG